MSIRSLRTVVLMVVIGLISLISRAATAQGSVFIDFEHLPGADGVLGTPDDVSTPICPLNICARLSNEFSSAGIVFTSGTLGQGNLFPGSTAANHFITSTLPDAILSRPVTAIIITSYSLWTTTLYALDENNNVIASNTLTNPNPGMSFLLGTLSVSSSRPIHRFTVLPAGCQIGSNRCNEILNLDNLDLIAPSPAAGVQVSAARGVPTISGWSIFGLLILLGTTGAVASGRRNGTH